MDTSRETFMNSDEKTRYGLTHDFFMSITTEQKRMGSDIQDLKDADKTQLVICGEQEKKCDDKFHKLDLKWAKVSGVIVLFLFALPIILRYL